MTHITHPLRRAPLRRARGAKAHKAKAEGKARKGKQDPLTYGRGESSHIPAGPRTFRSLLFNK
eukprot:1270666-Prymnesium_polylepis.1